MFRMNVQGDREYQKLVIKENICLLVVVKDNRYIMNVSV
jgi:hypothetical protein